MIRFVVHEENGREEKGEGELFFLPSLSYIYEITYS